MRRRSKKLLGVLLSLALLLVLLPGMNLTAYASPTETLLATITGTGSNTNPATSANVSYSTEGVATLTFSGSVVYQASPAWGWWGYGWTATVAPANGYTITKCVFYDDANRTATDSEAPFVVETTEEDKTPKVNGTPISADQSKGIKKIEVYGYATPTHTHSFTYSASGATITASCGEGCDITTGLTLSISAPAGNLVADGTTTFPATLSTGYNTTAFPANSISTISYTKDGQPFNGTPKDAGAYVASVTVGTGNGAATASVSYTIAAPQPTTYTVTLSGGGYTTYSGGDMSQTATQGQAMTSVTFTPVNGYHFEAYAGASQNGVTAVLSNGVITVSGTPTGNVAITIPAAVQDAPVTTTYKVNVNPQNCAWDITPREAWEGTGVPAGTLITVTPTPFVNYELESISWSKVGSQEKTDITNQGSFNMPASDVNVYIVCKPVGGGGGSSSGGGDEWYGGYATQRGYRVRLAPVENGSVILAVDGWSTSTEMSVVPTTLVCVYPTPAPGYVLESITWGPEGGAGTDITQNQSFVMPSMDVVVNVRFRPA